MRVYWIKKYLKQAAGLISEEERVVAETTIVAAPDYWPVVAGTEGARKARIPLEGRGKRGGGRVIDYWQSQAGKIYFITAYAKNQKGNLNHDDKKAIAKTVERTDHRH